MEAPTDPDVGVLPAELVAGTVSAEAVAPPEPPAPPAVATPTIVLPEAPGTRVSVLPEFSGVNVGSPFLAAILTSGPVLSAPRGRKTSLLDGRGACCSACMRAIAVGSGCGTGVPNFSSFAFES